MKKWVRLYLFSCRRLNILDQIKNEKWVLKYNISCKITVSNENVNLSKH
jgi:hypothetical protein